jgi:hypothetical protein
MTISVLLDLTEAVSVNDLWQFLSLVPQWHDGEKDIRAMDVKGLGVRFLEVEIAPSSEPDSRHARGQNASAH